MKKSDNLVSSPLKSEEHNKQNKEETELKKEIHLNSTQNRYFSSDNLEKQLNLTNSQGSISTDFTAKSPFLNKEDLLDLSGLLTDFNSIQGKTINPSSWTKEALRKVFHQTLEKAISKLEMLILNEKEKILTKIYQDPIAQKLIEDNSIIKIVEPDQDPNEAINIDFDIRNGILDEQLDFILDIDQPEADDNLEAENDQQKKEKLNYIEKLRCRNINELENFSSLNKLREGLKGIKDSALTNTSITKEIEKLKKYAENTVSASRRLKVIASLALVITVLPLAIPFFYFTGTKKLDSFIKIISTEFAQDLYTLATDTHFFKRIKRVFSDNKNRLSYNLFSGRTNEIMKTIDTLTHLKDLISDQIIPETHSLDNKNKNTKADGNQINKM